MSNPRTSEEKLVSGRGENSDTRALNWLAAALELRTGETPFPWQVELLRRFRAGIIDRFLDLPTGLGKTSVIAIWVVARAMGARLPMRLVYVVDRRAVVDQSTRVAEGVRRWVQSCPEAKTGLGLNGGALPISTLRGRFQDNREWLEDPGAPAIIVGTVDMIGSRLLFEGYGVSRKMRPYHAALLGCDSLVVLDEAHLVPPFEHLLEAVANGGARFGPRESASAMEVPPLRLLALSATGREPGGAGQTFQLAPADHQHPEVRRRLRGRKRLHLRELSPKADLGQALADEAWRLVGGDAPGTCVVFGSSRAVVEKAKAIVDKLAKPPKGGKRPLVDTELLVGSRREHERELALRRLRALGFLAGEAQDDEEAAPEEDGDEPATSAVLFATSAGEVGVDLDAVHMVCDLVAWERMVQRLGRVNRRGRFDADVVVMVPIEDKEPAVLPGEGDVLASSVRAVLEVLPRSDGAEALDASIAALLELKQRAQDDASLGEMVRAATTPEPLRPELTRPLLDAWAMTSLIEHPGRPEVGPWIRGWLKNDPPQSEIVWRTHIPPFVAGAKKQKELNDFFEAAPPHLSERLQTETARVVKWLDARAKRLLAKGGSKVTIPAAGEDRSEPEAEDEADDVAGASDTDTADAEPASIDAEEVERDGRGAAEPARDAASLAIVVLNTAREVVAAYTLDSLRALLDHVGRRKEFERTLAGSTLVIDAAMGGLSDGLLSDAADEAPPTLDGADGWAEAVQSSKARPRITFRVKATDQLVAAASKDRNWHQRYHCALRTSPSGDVSSWLVVDKWREDTTTGNDGAAGPPQLLDEHLDWTGQRAAALASRLRLDVGSGRVLEFAARLHDAGKAAERWQRAFRAKRDGIYAKTRGPIDQKLLDGYRHELGSLADVVAHEGYAALSDEERELALHIVAAHHGYARPVISTSGMDGAPPSAVEDLAREVALRFARLERQWGPWGLAWWESLLRAADQQASRANEMRAAAAPEVG